jgi:hypothetical protein
METICSAETSVDFQRTTRHYMLEERTFQTRYDSQGHGGGIWTRLHSPPQPSTVALWVVEEKVKKVKLSQCSTN